MYMRSATFRDIKQRRVLIPYQIFGATYRSQLQGSRIPKILKFRLKVAYMILLRMGIFIIFITVYDNIFPSVHVMNCR